MSRARREYEASGSLETFAEWMETPGGESTPLIGVVVCHHCGRAMPSRELGDHECKAEVCINCASLRAELEQARELLRRWAGPFPERNLIRDTKEFLNRKEAKDDGD